MNQRARIIIANILLGLSIVCIVAFLVEHFMTPPRPFWHKDLAWLALAFVIASGVVRGRSGRHAT
jgi:hypothetical protein